MEKDKVIKSYKGFDKDLKCRDFQFEIGKEYEEETAICCNLGFHACENPFDVFRYYPPTTSRYCEVEQSGEIGKSNDDSKVASTKIKIGGELGLSGIIKAGLGFVFEKVKTSSDKQATSGNESTAATSGNESTAATSGDWSTAATSGNGSTAATSGDWSTAATSGNWSPAATSGFKSTAATSGNGSTAATSGDWSTAATSGDWSTAATSGDWSTAATSGNWSPAATSGFKSTAATSGNGSTAATSGNESPAATSGDWSTAAVSGKGSVALVIGYKSKAKASIGSAICVCERGEWNGKSYPLIGIKAAIVDGENLKADTFYMLKNGEFVEAED